MVALVAKWVLNALALYIVARIVPGIRLEDFASALLAVALIALINTFLKPLLLLITLPINILSLGLFTFVLNALLLLLAGSLSSGFRVEGFGTALIGSILLSLVSTILHSLVR